MKTRWFLVLACFLFPLTLPAQWTWRNPLPQGNTLSTILVLDNNSIWAGGEKGTLMHSVNGGLDWTILNLRPERFFLSFNGLHFPDNSTGYAVDEFGYVFKTTDGGVTWDSIYYETDEYLRASCFTDVQNGHLACSGGKILRTTDGGVSWNSLYVNPPADFNTISFPSGQVGYAGGYAYIFKTTDAGNSWNLILNDTTKIINDLSFLSPSVGFAVGEQGLVMKTIDGGMTWDVHDLGNTLKFSSIGVFSADTILLNGIKENPGTIPDENVKYRSTDGGSTWTLMPLTGDTLNSKVIDCMSGGTAYAAGYVGCLEKTVDYGNTWTTVVQWVVKDSQMIFGIDFPSAQTGYAVCGGWEGSHGRIMKTIDGGATWSVLNKVFGYDLLKSVDFINENTGYVGGDNLYSTWDGGQTWTTRYTSSGMSSINSISFATPTTGVAVGDDGIFLRTTDCGQSWYHMTGVPAVSYWAVHFPDDTTGYAAGGNSILKTADGGSTWSILPAHYSLSSLWFTSKNRGFGCGGNGLIIRTTDGGESWDVLNTKIKDGIRSIHFYDADTGYAACDGFVLKTTDGGINWQKQWIPTRWQLNAVRTTGTCAFVGGDVTYLFGTTNGGIGVSTGPAIQKHFLSTSVYPNPSAGDATIKYTLAGPSDVEIRFFDAYGKQIKDPVHLRQVAGTYTLPFPSTGLKPGVYFYTLRVNNELITRKVLVAKD